MREKKDEFKILCLDGGGGKGVYTLGILKEVESLIGKPISEHFDLIYGTSTGSIITAGLALGKSVDEIRGFYLEKLPKIMKSFTAKGRSLALSNEMAEVFGDKTFSDVKTDVGIVATNFIEKKPLIFKSSVKYAHGLKATFVPGFGCSIADGVVSSCSAYPFFKVHEVKTKNQQSIQAVDGGYCANNPAFYALADAVRAFGVPEDKVKILSLGVGTYPESYPFYSWLQGVRLMPAMKLISLQLASNSSSLEGLFGIIANKATVLRINGTFAEPALATSLFEYRRTVLEKLVSKGRESFGT